MQQIQLALERIIQKLFDVHAAVILTCPDEQFGDYATNVALQLAGRLNRLPREIAQQISQALQKELGDQVKKIDIAGPGFINITISDAELARQATAAPTQKPQIYQGKTIVVEYSDPNPFKPLHAGHLYTTLVGDSIARLIQGAGAKTIRINYGGDVGLHVGRCMWGIVNHLGGELPQQLNNISNGDRPAWLGARYVEGTKAYEDDETAKAQIAAMNKRVYQIHEQNDHDSPFAQIYWTCRQWSYDYFAKLYKQLKVIPFDRYIPESEVTQLGLTTVREQLKKGVYITSENAVVFRGDDHGLHTRVFINSEGLPTYEAKDVGLSLTKWYDYHFDESIIITANEQAQYMQVVIASIRQFEPKPAKRTTHLTHGMVRFKGGAKFSSRIGNAPSALDILQAARQAAANSPVGHNESSVLAAVKYAFIKNRIGADIHYDPEESVSLEGNSGPYLQYAHARARSILAKADTPEQRAGDEGFEPAERSLVRKLTEYPEVLARAADELMPHHVCTYLYELAQVFNRFYEHNRVLGNTRQAVRLQLVYVYAHVLRDGLQILGIEAPEHL